MNIFISTTSFGEFDSSPLDALRRANLAPRLNPLRRKLASNELVEHAADAIGIIAGTENLNRETLEQLRKLRVISRCGAGLDNVDTQATEQLGIKVYNTPWGPTRAVAELTVGLILDCLRGISQSDRSIRAGQWQKPMGWLLEGKTVGIIGFGRIGKEVTRLVKSLGAVVIACDITPPQDSLGVKITSLENVIANSDIITLHVPGDAGCIINRSSIALMKQSAILINASRGELVDEDALYEALNAKRLAAAAIDTPSQEPYTGKLTQLENIILTPHIGSYAKEARVLMEKQAVENLLLGLHLCEYATLPA